MFWAARTCTAPPRAALLTRARVPVYDRGRALLLSRRHEFLLRRFSAKPPNAKYVQPGKCHSGTITVQQPGDTDIRSLIDRIEPFPTPIPHAQSPTIVLLVTPSFASSLKAPRGTAAEAIGQVASRILKNSLERSSPLADIRLIAAVVDRLPVPSRGSATSNVSEGLAYALWHNDETAQTGWRSKPEPSQREANGTLTFDFWDRQGTPDKDVKAVIHQVTLTLANTIFQTGQKSTAFDILYKASEADQSRDMLLPEPRSLSAVSVESILDQCVRWPLSDQDLTYPKELRLNLIPLTTPRPVYAAMGNIIRQVLNSEGHPQPASQELEKAVYSYFSATGQDPHPMPVWAIVSSQDSAREFSSRVLCMLDGRPLEKPMEWKNCPDVLSERVHETWNIDPKTIHPLLWKHFKDEDARVHRVLSGGGGWGKKAGLLSLDPARVLAQQQPETASPLFSYDDGFSSEPQPLRKVAAPGQYIQFFASSVSSLDTPPYAPDTCVFGTLPSSIDDIPETARAEPSGVEAWPGYFGALSEQNMGIELIHDLPDGRRSFARSVFDVPYTLFVTQPKVSRPTGHNQSTPPSAASQDHSKREGFGLGRTTGNALRSLHDQARPSFDPCSRRHFSCSLPKHVKTNKVLKYNRMNRRMMIPISIKYRQIKEQPPLDLEDLTEKPSLELMLSMYRQYWRVSRWIVATAQAKLDATPDRRDTGKPLRRGGFIWLARDRLNGYIAAAAPHADQLRDGNMRLLDLLVQFSEHRGNLLQLELEAWTRQHRNVREDDSYSQEQRKRQKEEQDHVSKLAREIKKARVAVAPLPFNVNELFTWLEEMVHKSRCRCKGLEDIVYGKVIRYRKYIARQKRTRYRAFMQEDEEPALLEAKDSPFARQNLTSRRAPFGRVQLTNRNPHEGTTRSVYGARSFSTSRAPLAPPALIDSRGSDHDAPSTVNDAATGTRISVDEEATSPASQPSADHRRQAPDDASGDDMVRTSHVQALFARKRRARLYQRGLVERSLARLAVNETAFIAQSLQHSSLIITQIAERVVAIAPAAAHGLPALSPSPIDGGDYNARRREGWIMSHAPLRVQRQRMSDLMRQSAQAAESDELRMVGVVAEDVQYLEAEIGRLSWRVAMMKQKARANVDRLPRSKPAAQVVARSAAEQSMVSFRVFRATLLDRVKAELAVEGKNWRKWRLTQHVNSLRDAEMRYLESVVDGMEEQAKGLVDLTVMIAQQASEMQMMRNKGVVNKEGGIGVGRVVRLVGNSTPINVVMNKKADQVWALARDLEDMLAQ